MLGADAVPAAVNERTTIATTSQPNGRAAKMAPSPDNDTAPKAPDKTKHESCLPNCPKEKNKHDKTLSDLNDRELKALLDEAANYKNPKDREGKSSLFNYLLNEAEQDERNARASRAGGSELVRYCNPSAKRNSRHRKKPSSISENMMHGGSLDNLAKEELFETSKHRTKKSVSARQREGGSLPCNVNASTVTNLEYQFLEEARKKKEMREKIFVPNDLEAHSLLEHDCCLAQDYQEQAPSIEVHHYPVSQPAKYTSRATLQVNNVDDPIQVPHLEAGLEKGSLSAINKKDKYVFFPSCITSSKVGEEGKRFDENGNAVQVGKLKKKKLADKNVVVCTSESVEGHRSDIIHDVNKLMEFIGETKDQSSKNNRSNLHKSKQLNRHTTDDAGKGGKKQRAQSSKSKDSRMKLQKSNSLGEISTASLDDFAFNKDKVVMRNNKNIDKPRERRSWGNMEPLPLQNLYTNASAENLESAEFRVVTKKKKSKKRRSSISGRPKTSSTSSSKGMHNRGPSPDLRRKSACSVPHSEKSNDSSDVDSVHSLPIDTQRLDLTSTHLNMPISYADMARTSDAKPKERKPAAVNPVALTNDKAVPKEAWDFAGNPQSYVNHAVASVEECVKISPPDVHNIKNFPAIIKHPSLPAVHSVNAVADGTNKTGSKTCKSVAVNNGVVSKNVKNNVVNTTVYAGEYQNCVQNDLSAIETADKDTILYSASLPPDIPDVQTIEKMQLIGQGHPYDEAGAMSNSSSVDCGSADCDSNERTNVDPRPPVVILSGLGSNKEVPGLVFGFDVNEQLLSEDAYEDFCCEEFIARYIVPEVFTTTSHNHDKIVGFIGTAWEDAIENLSSGKVQYYSDLL